MSELIAMYSVDGYAAGQIVEVRLDGNTNVNGRNAAGKTALIKMVPSFYGVAPGTLQRQETNSRSFADYYLPNITSYLAFVYLRDGKWVTVVITRKAGGGAVDYRFVLGKCEDSWFLQELAGTATFVTSSNWRSHMTQAGYEVSSSVGYEDYRLIIQSSLRYHSSDRKKDQLITQYRNLYSYPTQGRDISNIHLLASAVLQRKPSMAAIKSILESVLINQGVIDNGQLDLNLQANKVAEWIENRRAYLSVDEQRASIINLADRQDNFERVRARLADIKSLSQQCKEQLELQQTSLTAVSQQCQKDIVDYDKQATLQRNAAKSEIDGVSEKMAVQQQKAQALEIKKNGFDAQDIPSQRALAARVTALQKQHQRAEKALNDLKSGAADLTRFYEQSRLEAQTQVRGKQEQLKQQQHGHEVLCQEQQLIAKDQVAQQLNALEQNQNLKLNALHQEYSRLAGEIGLLSGQLENIGPSAAIVAQGEEFQRQRRLSQTYVERTRLDLEAAQAALVQAKTESDDSILEGRALHKAIERHECELELARARLMPKDGSLLSFLRANREDWSQNIAKVIDPGLLLRSDLHPQLVNHLAPSDSHGKTNSPAVINNQPSLFGVTLDVSGIEVPDFANDHSLQVEIQRLDEQLAQRLAERERHEKIAAQLQKSYAEANKKVALEEHNLRRCQDQVLETERDLEELEVLAKSDILMRRDKLKKRKAELTEQETAAKDHQQHLIDQHCQAKETLQKQSQEDVDKLRAKLEQQQAQTKQELSALNEALELKLQQIRDEEAAALSERGIDERAVDRATQAANDANREYSAAKTAVLFIAQLARFMADLWPEHALLAADIAKFQTQIAKLEQQRDQILSEIRAEICQLQKSQAQADHTLSEVNENLAMVGNGLANMVSVDPPATVPSLTPIHTATYLLQRWQDLYAEAQLLSEVGREQFIKIRRAFNRNVGSQAHEFYQRLEREQRDVNKRWETPECWAVAAPYLLQYLNDGHHHSADMLRTSAKMLGQNLSDFSAQLERVHRQVKALGNQVTEQTESICGNFAALDKLSVKVFSNVDKLDYYSSLKAFAQIHNDWVATELDSLPNDEYLHRLDAIKTLIEKSGITTKVQDSFGIEVRVVDQGVEKVARRDKDMDGISSNGVSYLIIILIYNALVNLLRGGTEDVLVWPIDELKDFDLDNTKAMIGQLNQDNIRIFSAFPDADPAVLRYFQHLYQASGRKDSNKRQLVRYADLEVSSAGDDLKAALAGAADPVSVEHCVISSTWEPQPQSQQV